MTTRAFLFLVFGVWSTAASAQTYTFTTFAGVPSSGSDDGNAGVARFCIPNGVAVDNSGNVFVADTDNHTIRKITAEGTVMTLAGAAGVSGSADGMGGAARFNSPWGVAVDDSGNVFVADSLNHTIRKITAGGAVTTLAGFAGSLGSTNGTGASARFNAPHKVAVDSSGNVFVADTSNHTIRKITADGAVTTLAGAARLSGSADGVGSAARFDLPNGVAVDDSGNVFVTETGNHTIRKITPGGVVTTLAGSAEITGRADGTGASARFNFPYGVAVDGNGNLFVADTDNHSIRRITAGGVVTTWAGAAGPAGSADGNGGAARFFVPRGVAVDRSGNVYVADTYNHLIRKITANGVVSRLAGQVTTGSTDGAGTAAQFNMPEGVAVGRDRVVYVADTSNHTIRRITATGAVTTLAGTAGSSGTTDGTGVFARFSSPYGVAVDGGGNVFVADTNNYTIRKITASGTVSTLAGLARSAGNADGTGGSARFKNPRGIALDANGNLYVADAENHTIRKITSGGSVTTLAGTAGSPGTTDGIGSAALFNTPCGLAVDGGGNVWVADSENHTIRKITAGGIVTTVAGTAGSSGSSDGIGGAARFNFPRGVAVETSGNVLVADSTNHTIRRITAAGVVTTLAGAARSFGSADGTGDSARFGFVNGVAVDGGGNVFVTDGLNHTIRMGVPAFSRLANLSTRALVPAGEELTVGFVIRGGASKSVLVRAVGPTLTGFGVGGALDDPKLEIIPAGASRAIFSNDDWGGGVALAGAFAEVGAFPLHAASRDAAVLAALPTAGYTARITSGAPGGSGIAIAEVYDRDTGAETGRLVNVSTLGYVGTAAQALVPGFVIAGTGTKQLLIRAIGPGLATFGVTGRLADPQLTVIPLGQVAAVASNDNWDGSVATTTAFTQAGAFLLTPASKDAALVVRLPPGGYTVNVSGVGDTTGTALVEIYDLDP